VEARIEKPRFFRDRLVYYQSKMITEQLRRGHRYGLLRPAYCVGICNFAVLPELPGYIHHIELREATTGMLFTDLENIVIIELSKMPREDDGNKA
jgi:predicted transposase/invertase (TIGR01784 family)